MLFHRAVAILSLVVGVVMTAAPTLSATIDIVDGRGREGPVCAAILTPDAATDAERPLRFRVISNTGIDLALSTIRSPDAKRVELVIGERRLPFDRLVVRDLSDLEADPVLALFEAHALFHLTETLDDGTIRTARFDNVSLVRLAERMAKQCGVYLPNADTAAAERALRLAPGTIRLLKWAIYRELGEKRDLDALPPTLDGATRDQIVQALQAKGLPPSKYLTRETALGLLSDLGVMILPKFDDAGAFGDTYAPAASRGRWGMITRTGEWVLRPVFTKMGPVPGRLAPTKISGRWRLVWPDGSRLRRMVFDRLLHCAEGICAVEMNGAIAFVDLVAERQIAAGFETVRPFSDGSAVVRKNGRWRILDRSGNLSTASFVANDMQSPMRNRIPAKLDRNRGWIFLNLAFDKVGTTFYQEIRPLGGGLAAVRSGRRWGVIETRSGQMLVKPAFADIRSYARGLAPATQDGQTWGYIDKAGRWAIGPRFAEAGPFSQGFARVRLPQNGVGFLDTRGKLAMPAIFDAAGEFANGHAAVRVGNVWGYISREKLLKPIRR